MRVISNDDCGTEFEQFAALYHQDFGILNLDHLEMASGYISGLSQAQRQNFREQIRQLVLDYPGKDEKGLQNAWLRAGAQHRLRDLREFLVKIEALL